MQNYVLTLFLAATTGLNTIKAIIVQLQKKQL